MAGQSSDDKHDPEEAPTRALGRWLLAILTALSVAVSTASLLLAGRVHARVGPSEASTNQVLTVGLTVSTVVVLALLACVLVAHAVILTRPFPGPSRTPLRKENYRLGEIADAVHSAIEEGRRR